MRGLVFLAVACFLCCAVEAHRSQSVVRQESRLGNQWCPPGEVHIGDILSGTDLCCADALICGEQCCQGSEECLEEVDGTMNCRDPHAWVADQLLALSFCPTELTCNLTCCSEDQYCASYISSSTCESKVIRIIAFVVAVLILGIYWPLNWSAYKSVVKAKSLNSDISIEIPSAMPMVTGFGYHACLVIICLSSINVINPAFITLGLYLGMCFCICPYLCESACCSKTGEFISSLRVQDDVSEYLTDILAQKPDLALHVVCSHRERRTRHSYTTDSDGNRHRHTEHYYVDVKTYDESFGFSFVWRDESDNLNIHANLSFTKVQFGKQINPGDDLTNKGIAAMKQELYDANKHRDKKCEVTFVTAIPSYRDKLMMQNVPELPCLLVGNGIFFYLISFLGYSYIYRCWLAKQSENESKTIRKKFWLLFSPEIRNPDGNFSWVPAPRSNPCELSHKGLKDICSNANIQMNAREQLKINMIMQQQAARMNAQKKGSGSWQQGTMPMAALNPAQNTGFSMPAIPTGHATAPLISQDQEVTVPVSPAAPPPTHQRASVPVSLATATSMAETPNAAYQPPGDLAMGAYGAATPGADVGVPGAFQSSPAPYGGAAAGGQSSSGPPPNPYGPKTPGNDASFTYEPSL